MALKVVLLAVVLLAVLGADGSALDEQAHELVAAADEPCCVGACPANLTKFYSIAWAFDSRPLVHNCGETCMVKSDFLKFKLFEPHLKFAESDTPCSDFGYNHYKSTQTHGVPGLKCTLDLYSNETATVAGEVAEER